jgi:hypothetical protein
LGWISVQLSNQFVKFMSLHAAYDWFCYYLEEKYYKGKDTPVLRYHVMKTYGKMEVKLHAFVTCVLDGCEWWTSCSDGFTLDIISPGNRWIQFWMIPVGSMAVVTKIKILRVQIIDISRPSCSKSFIDRAKKDEITFNYTHDETSKFINQFNITTLLCRTVA